VSADDFFGALREVCVMNKIPEFYEDNLETYKRVAAEFDYVISLDENAQDIMKFVDEVAQAGALQLQFCLTYQAKTYEGDLQGDLLITSTE
jgi:hypothetical protein